MAEPPENFESLQSRLENLEKRVTALEKADIPNAGLAPSRRAPATHVVPAAAAASAGSTLSVFGRAMLGIAGAYLLRAAAASNSVPKPVIAALALVYALGWVMSAARASAWLSRTAYACTSALILAPMLWELTLRFHVLVPAATACALAAFVAVALAYSLRRSVIPAVWVANATAAGLALALAVAAHSILPFALLLVAMLAAAEFSARHSSERSVRVLVAVAADLAVWIEIYVYSAPANTQTGYPALPPAALLFPALLLLLLSCGFAILRSVLRRQPLSAFDILQSTAAFLLGVCALLLFAPAVGATTVGLACLILAAAFYAVAYTLFPGASQTRNCAVFSTWSAALLLAGLGMSMDARWLSGSLGVASLAAMLAGARLERLALQFHGAVYLTISAVAAGLPAFIAHALSGPAPARPQLPAGFAAACAVLCYLAAHSEAGESRRAQVLHLYLATAAAVATAAFLIDGMLRIFAHGVAPQAHHLAFLRTLVLCLLALGLAFAGARGQRPELTRIGYATVALVALKLLAEDLRNGHMEYIAASICLFALTLIAVPRVARGAPARMSRKQP